MLRERIGFLAEEAIKNGNSCVFKEGWRNYAPDFCWRQCARKSFCWLVSEEIDRYVPLISHCLTPCGKEEELCEDCSMNA
jgi:hypothetical protein